MTHHPLASSRYRGALLGLACGDALGASAQLGTPGLFTPIADLAGGGPFDLAPGEWTDDTSTALCLAESLVDRRGFDGRDQLARYLRWHREGHMTAKDRRIGVRDAMREALERFERGVDPSGGEADRSDAGSLVRAAPVALFYASAPREAIGFAAAASRVTHDGHAEIDACRYLAALVVGAIEGRSKQEILSPGFSPVRGIWDEAPLCPEIAEIARGSFTRRSPPEITSSGGAARSLEAGLWALHASCDFAEGCLLAANLGGDSDVAGAVVGLLAGALLGERAIPARFRDRIARRAAVLALAERLHDVAVTRVPDPPFHGAYWVEPGAVLAGPYPGGAVATLIDAGAALFVDLTEAIEMPAYAPALARHAAAIGRDAEHRRIPVRDRGVPSAGEMRAILDAIEVARRGGTIVYVHCLGGIGRTGTAVGCRLVERGMSPDAALARIEELRKKSDPSPPRSPETEAQFAFVRAWEPRTRAAVAGPEALAAALAGVVIGEPVEYGALTLFPLIRAGRDHGPAYVTLDHALDHRTVTLREISEAGSVPEIEAVNRGVTAVLLLEGQELVGAKQNRVVNVTTLVPPRASRRIAVTCVEQGRWSYSSRDFASGPSTLLPGMRGQAARDVSRSLAESGVRSVDQHAVWRDLARASVRLGATSPTGAMDALYAEHERVILVHVEALAPVPDQIGVVFAMHGEIVGFDLFDAASTLRAALSKLVKAYAVDALERPARVAPASPLDRAAAARLLDAAARAPAIAYDAVGLGRELRFTTETLAGSALVTHEGVVHASAFWTCERPPEDDSDRPSRRFGARDAGGGS